MGTTITQDGQENDTTGTAGTEGSSLGQLEQCLGWGEAPAPSQPEPGLALGLCHLPGSQGMSLTDT